MTANQNNIENIIIVGSGPAGLTSAIYTSRANLSPLMFEGEDAGGQLMTTTEVENFPGFPNGITGPELIEQMRKQAEKFGTRFISKHINKVDLSSRPFKVWAGNQEFRAQSLIISTGASAKYLGLPSEKKYMGKGVSACATCDGAFFRNLVVGVVGGGDTAMEEAQFLTRFASKVILIHRRHEFRASKIMSERVKNHPKIQIIWNSEVIEVMGDDRVVKSAKVKNLTNGEIQNITMDGLFLAIGHTPNTAIFKGQIEVNEVGYIKTKPGSTFTNIPGVFAAGDVQDPHYRQAITAAGSGCAAAIDCERWLEEQKI